MSTRQTTSGDHAVAPNAQRLLWAGFMAILASGVGFSVRSGILTQWSEQFGFTMTELGAITGGGLTGFGIIIILASLLADTVGYGKLMSAAFVLHVISAAITLAAPAAFAAGGKDAAFQCLFWGMFLFAVGNGVCEAVVNPLTATLFPKQKTHYLNILHAGWPAGLVVGGLASALMAAKLDDAGSVVAKAVDCPVWDHVVRTKIPEVGSGIGWHIRCRYAEGLYCTALLFIASTTCSGWIRRIGNGFVDFEDHRFHYGFAPKGFGPVRLHFDAHVYSAICSRADRS
jgi:MFS family permease